MAIKSSDPMGQLEEAKKAQGKAPEELTFPGKIHRPLKDTAKRGLYIIGRYCVDKLNEAKR